MKFKRAMKGLRSAMADLVTDDSQIDLEVDATAESALFTLKDEDDEEVSRVVVVLGPVVEDEQLLKVSRVSDPDDGHDDEDPDEDPDDEGDEDEGDEEDEPEDGPPVYVDDDFVLLSPDPAALLGVLMF